MQTARRLYFYAMALLGAEAFAWGLIGLLRSLASASQAPGAQNISNGMALLLVGIPVFLFHWLTVQRDAARDAEEGRSLTRAVFLYAARTAFLIPSVSSLLAILNRALATAQGLGASAGGYAAHQSYPDNLIALGVCLLLHAYFTWILAQEWRSALPATRLAGVRRLFRLTWMGAGLALAVIGAAKLLGYLLRLPSGEPAAYPGDLSGGLTFLLVGAPLWAWFWQKIQGSQIFAEERRSNLRQAAFYLLLLAALTGILAAAGAVLAQIFESILQQRFDLAHFLWRVSNPLAAGLPLAGVWVYFGGIARRESGVSSPAPLANLFRTIFRGFSALLGLVFFSFGLAMLMRNLSVLIFSQAAQVPAAQLAGALALIVMGQPLWLRNWAALRDGMVPDGHLPLIRRVWLYTVLFFAAASAMMAAGLMLYTVFSRLLSLSDGTSFLVIFSDRLGLLLTALIVLIYHQRVLGEEQRSGRSEKARRAANFPLLFLADEAELGALFSQEMTSQAPGIPLAVHIVDQGAPGDDLLTARVIVLPVRLALEPPEPLRIWLAGSQARRWLLPLGREDWNWLGLPLSTPADAVRDAARKLARLAQGEETGFAFSTDSASVAGWVAAGVLGAGVFALLVSLILGGVFG